LLAVLWLKAVFSPHDPVADPHGVGELLWLVVLSFLHLLLGVALLIASRFGTIRAYLGIAVVSAPIFHLAGSPFERPWCDILFVAPSIAILLAAVVESILGARPAVPVDNEP
jgi:hypothetical protein